MSQVES